MYVSAVDADNSYGVFVEYAINKASSDRQFCVRLDWSDIKADLEPSLDSNARNHLFSIVPILYLSSWLVFVFLRITQYAAPRENVIHKASKSSNSRSLIWIFVVWNGRPGKKKKKKTTHKCRLNLLRRCTCLDEHVFMYITHVIHFLKISPDRWFFWHLIRCMEGLLHTLNLIRLYPRKVWPGSSLFIKSLSGKKKVSLDKWGHLHWRQFCPKCFASLISWNVPRRKNFIPKGGVEQILSF